MEGDLKFYLETTSVKELHAELEICGWLVLTQTIC